MMYSTSSSSSTPLQRPQSSSYLETSSSFYGTHIPINIRRRKRTSPDENWAKYATKCVLASPLIVLVLWSLAVMTHSSSKQNVQSKAGRTNSIVVEPRSMTADTNILRQEYIPVVVPLGQQQQQQSTTVVVRPRPHPQSPATQQENTMQSTQGDSVMMKTQGGNAMMTTESGGNAMMTTESGGNAMMTTESGGNAMMTTESGSNALMTTESGSNALMTTESGGNAMMTTENNGNARMTTENSGNAMQNNLMMITTQGLMNTQGSNVMTTSENAQNNMQNSVAMMNTQGSNAMMTARNGKVAAMKNTQGKMSAPDNTVIMKSGNARMNTQDNAAMMNTQGRNTMMAAEINVHPTKKTRILYYDPAVGTETVYDADGTPILLSSLQTDNTEIYLEKPLLGVTEQQQHAPPPLELDYHEWGESQAQDQMIIVSTVATMALLVGALSARRLRSRQFLASCIENESLEDEVAYDTAYTTNGYDTFVGPWKGDLEKFDV